MKIKLTKNWKQQKHSVWELPAYQSKAMFGIIRLSCRMVSLPWLYKEWVGQASLGDFKRNGPVRGSEQKAKQDAERCAIELLRDIRDGTKMLMDKYGMEEED